MAEEQNTTPQEEKQTVKMTTMPLEAIVTLEVSGIFLQRIHGLMVTMCDEVGQEETIKIFERLKNDQAPQTTHEESIRVLLALIDGIETAAREQGKIQEKEYSHDEAFQMLEFLNIRPTAEPPRPTGN